MDRSTWTQAWAVHFMGALLLAVHAAVFDCVNRHVAEPYMDEPFHVPQTQLYCSGRFDAWDPKITTLPGLYFVGTLYGWLLKQLCWMKGDTSAQLCSTGVLRSLNVLLSVACFYTFNAIIAQLNGMAVTQAASTLAAKQQQFQQQQNRPSQFRSGSRLLYAFVLSLLPVHWFYGFLYYTDTGSMLCLLLCLLLALRGHCTSSAAAGAAAVLFRQTNAVWVAFVLGTSILQFLRQQSVASLLHPAVDVGMLEASASSSSEVNNQRQHAGFAEQQGADTLPMVPPVTRGLISELHWTLGAAWQLRLSLLREFWLLLLVPLAFLAFAVINGGVVVGDRTAHVPARHWAQPLYYSLFAGTMLSPVLVLPASKGRQPALLEAAAAAIKTVRGHPLQTAGWSIVLLSLSTAALLQSRSSPHPYLVADNRHLTFYVWRRILARGGVPGATMLAGMALAAWWTLMYCLSQCQTPLWLLGYAACLLMTLVPAWLLEFRYFTPGLLLLALHLKTPSNTQLTLMLILYCAVNAGTMYMFLIRPFGHWSDGSAARFIW